MDPKLLTDGMLITLIRSADYMDLPLERRFEGDTDAIDEFMREHRFKQTVVDKLLIKAALMREALHRGIQITNYN